jgi:predicted RNA binding protein YcfA (HicA-like mRNA interferase family)
VSFSGSCWDQIRGVTVEELIRGLEKDGWTQEPGTGSSARVYYKGLGERVSIHFHPGKTYGAKMLKGLLADIGWSEDDMKRLKLIK